MVNYFLYKSGQFIALHLPLEISYRVAALISDLHYMFAAKDRSVVKENLKAIFPEKPDREIRIIRRRVFRNFAKYLVDFFRFSRIDKEYIKNNIKIENICYLDEALSKNKGVIVLSAHLGNWELGGIIIALSGYPFWVVALPHKQKDVDKFFNFQRESKGVKVIPLGKAVRTCLNVLSEKKMVALLGDRDFTERGITVDFFGKATLLPEGPAAFSLKTGAPIVPGFMLRNKDDSFTLRFEKPIFLDSCPETTNRVDKYEELAGLIMRYKIIIEDYIKKYPDQWYMFRRFWTL